MARYSSTSALDGGERSAKHPDRFTPGEGAPGSWVGSRVIVDAVEKRKKIPSLHLPGTELQSSSP